MEQKLEILLMATTGLISAHYGCIQRAPLETPEQPLVLGTDQKNQSQTLGVYTNKFSQLDTYISLFVAQFGELQMEGLETSQICYFSTYAIPSAEVAVPPSQASTGESAPWRPQGKCLLLLFSSLSLLAAQAQGTTLHLQRDCWVLPV